MNANELANLLEPSTDPDVRKAVAMLRQQQAEIERVKELCASYIKSDYEVTCMFKPMMEELYGK